MKYHKINGGECYQKIFAVVLSLNSGFVTLLDPSSAAMVSPNYLVTLFTSATSGKRREKHKVS